MKPYALLFAVSMFAVPTHADSQKVVYIDDHLQWQTPYGTVYEELILQGPATDGPVGFGEFEDESIFESGPGSDGVEAVWATPFIKDPVPVWNGYLYLFGRRDGKPVVALPEPSGLALLAIGLLSLFLFRLTARRERE